MRTCPICEKGVLRKGSIEEKMFGIFLGMYEAEICDKCNESFLDEGAMKRIESRAKELGLWGVAKKVKIIKSGNSIAIRIPAQLARFLDLKEGAELLLYPEGKEKIICEIT
jgi:hypothetical protein